MPPGFFVSKIISKYRGHNMEGITSTTFGYIIAFFLPGFVCLQSLSYASETIRNILDTIKGKDPSLGIVFYALIAALICGLILSAFRSVILEWVYCKWKWEGKIKGKRVLFKIKPVDRSPVVYAKLLDDKKLALYQASVDNNYRYYQFYGNLCISLSLLLFCRYVIAEISITDTKGHFLIFSANVLIIVFLFFAAKNSLRGVYKAIGEICS
jgi:hypothetical protein